MRRFNTSIRSASVDELLFDEAKCVVTGDEFAEIRGTLTQVVALNGGRNVFKAVFAGPDFMVALNQQAGPAASDEQIAAGAIHACMRREWLDDPCWLVRLLLYVKNASGVNGVNPVVNIDAMIQRLSQKINVHDEVWYAHWVEDGLPFIDRTALRQTLKEFARTTGRGILRIDGDSQTGKSYSRNLLEHASRCQGWPFRIISVELEPGSEIGMTATILAQLIVAELGYSNELASSGIQDATVENILMLQTWILRCARESQKYWWFYLDGFSSLPESNTARSLIQGLADKIANSSYRENLRLILVGYDKPLSRVEEEKIAFDRSDSPLSPQFREQAVYDCLDRLFQEVHRIPAPGELDSIAKALVADLPEQNWIVILNKKLRALAKALRNGQ